jgi:predicted permease
MSALIQDFKYSLRMLGKNPGFTIVAILTLALGIGANTAIFSVVNGLLLHPDGISHPDRVVAVRVRYEKLNLKSILVSATDFRDVRDSRKVFAAAAVADNRDFSYQSSDWPLRLRGAAVSHEWFDVFETKPMLGRVFTPDEDQPNANHEVILSYNTWKNVFGSDAAIVGRSLQLNHEPYRIVGVMGPDFQWPGEADLWSPLGLSASDLSDDNRFNEGLFCVARVQPRLKFATAAAYMDILTQRIANDRRSPYAKSSGWSMFAVPFTQFVYGDIRTPLLVLIGAVGCVLLIACANIAGLTLARASGRTKEFAIRTSLGASPWRLVRQMLVESFVVAAGGMALGLLLGEVSIRALLALAQDNLGKGITVRMDGYVLLFTALAAIASAFIFGIAPAWHISRIDPQSNLGGGRGADAGSRVHRRYRDALVMGQLALALLLLASTGLFLKSLSRLQDVNLGFRPHGVMTAVLSLSDRQYETGAKQSALFREILQRLSNAPGVTSAAAAYPLPFSGFGGSASFAIEGRPKTPGDPGPHGDVQTISPGYFSTMGIPILRGREFTAEDREDGQAVVMIDANLARQFWPNNDPIGKRLRINDSDPWATIVGVAAATRHAQVVGEEASSEGIESSGKGVYYYPINQAGMRFGFLIARTKGDAGGLANTMREVVRSADPGQPVSDLKTMDQRVVLSLGPRRSAVALLAVFAALAMILSGVGLFGLVRYSVGQRTREFGIRAALGASSLDLLRMVLGQGLRLAILGAAAGLVGAATLSRVLQSLLYGVSPIDPVIFAAVTLMLILVALVACWLPARRAMRINPMEALRHE